MRDSVPAPTILAERLRLCLVCSSDLIETAVRLCCPAPDALTVFSLEGIVNDDNTLSRHGEAIAEAAASAEVVLVEWQFDKAPVINTLGYRLRRRLAGPLLALCQAGQDDLTAAIAAGADSAVTFPLQRSLLRAHALSYHRLVEAARQAAHAETPGQAQPPETPGVLRLGALRLDRAARRFFVGEAEVELTPREFALLGYLLDHSGAACSRDQILEQVWGISFDTGTNMVDVYMYFLRRKLEAHGVEGVIQTVRGFGYRLALPDTPPTPATD